MQTTEKTTQEIYLEIARNEHDRAMQGKSNQAKRATWRALCAAMDEAKRASGQEIARPQASEPNESNQPTTHSLLQRRLAAERGMVAVDIGNQLATLRQRVDQAIAQLQAGRALDPGLIANFVMLTHSITRWNTVLELQPYADDPDHGGAPRPD